MRQAAGRALWTGMGFIFRSKQAITPGFELSGLPALCRAALMSDDIPPVVCVYFYFRRTLGKFVCCMRLGYS